MEKTSLLCLLLLVGCKANRESLPDFVAETVRDTQKEVQSMAPSPEYNAISFQDAMVTPFDLPMVSAATQPSQTPRACWQPKMRNKQSLEQYRLNELTLKGLMSRGEGLTGLIELPDKRIVAVRAGQYLGENNGQIKRVTKQALVIHETLSDGLGCWYKRQTKLSLK
ncbi:pilus assembly protein PilP [Vibrio parahaemolyticus]